ncbi:hypothetical protein LTR24_008824 [Lithohypha guttulata]|uniref:Uncharacterized protein n=1 Tax=Lithohypha guttulata TaxID=1690604 RepID=A0ABR0JYW0_9EURO|nr:hypothetical protein LTR24_008824 [Lithohypha guttulata]
MREFRDDGPYKQLSDPVVGDVWNEDTCIAIHWGYISFPVAIVLLTMVFLLSTIAQTSSHGPGQLARGWTSSPLPLIYPGLDVRSQIRPPGAAVDSRPGIWRLQADVKGMHAQLKYGDIR